MYIVITYDVNTEENKGKKRLRQVSKLCVNHGQRVQNSVFECLLDPAEYVNLKSAISAIVDPQRDNVRFYLLGKDIKNRVEVIGKETSFDIEDTIIV